MKKILCLILFFSTGISFAMQEPPVRLDLYRNVFPRGKVMRFSAGAIACGAGLFSLIKGIKDRRKGIQAKRSGTKLKIRDEKDVRDASMLIWIGSFCFSIGVLLSGGLGHEFWRNYLLRAAPKFRFNANGLYDMDRHEKVCEFDQIKVVQHDVDEDGGRWLHLYDHSDRLLVKIDPSEVLCGEEGLTDRIVAFHTYELRQQALDRAGYSQAMAEDFLQGDGVAPGEAAVVADIAARSVFGMEDQGGSDIETSGGQENRVVELLDDDEESSDDEEQESSHAVD